MKKLSFFSNNQIIEVDVEATTNKNMYMKVRDNKIVVLAPQNMPEKYIQDFVAEHVNKFNKYIEKSKQKIYISFEEKYFYLFGKKHFFEIIGGFTEAKIVKKGTKFFAQATDASKEEIVAIIEDFCKNELRGYITKRIGELEIIMNVEKHQLKVSKKMQAWGTNYLTKGLITFSATLSHYPKKVIDYVIVHELAHDHFPDHSDAFWNDVKKYVPDYKELRNQLKSDKKIIEE